MSLKQIVVSKAVDTIDHSSVFRLTSGIEVGSNDFTTVLTYANAFFAGYPVFASPRIISGPNSGQRRIVLAVANNRWEIYLSDMTNLNNRVTSYYHGDAAVFNPLMTTWRPLSASGVGPFPSLQLIAPTEELSINVVRSSKYSEVYESQLEDQVFAMVSDQGSGDSNQTNVVSMIQSWNPNFVVTAGDNIYTLNSSLLGGQADIQFNNVIGTPFQSFISANAFFPAIGNHDVDLGTAPTTAITPNGNYERFAANWFRGKFPNVFKNNKNYYRVRPFNGYTEFFVLNSGYASGSYTDPKFFYEPDGNTIGSVQYEWLSRALKDSDALYKIVVLHHPPFTNEVDYTPGFPPVRWDFGAMGASAVISGHAHNYERFLNQTIPYLVIGHGGATLRNYTKSASDSVSIIDNPPRFGALRCVANSRSLLIENRIFDGALNPSIVQDSFRINPISTKWTVNNTFTSTADKSQTDSALRVNIWPKAQRFNDFGQLLPTGIVECRIPTIAANTSVVLYTLSLGKIGNPSNLVVEFVPLKEYYDNGGNMFVLSHQIGSGNFPPELKRVSGLFHYDAVGNVPNYLRFYVTSNLASSKASRMSGYSSPFDTSDHTYIGYNLNRLNYTGYNFSYSGNGMLAGHYGPYKAGVLGCTNARVSLVGMSIANSFDSGTQLYLYLRNASSTAWVPTSSNEEAWAAMYWTP